MAYNPKSMYNPAVKPDTGEAMGRAIASAGQSVAQGIEGFASAKHAAQAADQEFDLFQTMYPDTAALMDPEKFASANLAGKQKMLGLAKGYVLQQTQEAQRAEAMEFRQKQMDLRTQLNTVTTKDGGTLVMTGDGQVAYSARPPLPEKTPGPITMQDLGNGTRAVVQDGKLERVLTDPTMEQLRPRYVPVDGSGFKIAVDANGNRVSGLPAMQTQRGPFAGGLTRDVPVSGAAAANAPIKIIEQDGQSYRLGPDGVTLIPLRIQGGAPAAAAPAASAPSFLNWKPAP